MYAMYIGVEGENWNGMVYTFTVPGTDTKQYDAFAPLPVGTVTVMFGWLLTRKYTGWPPVVVG